MRPLTVLAAAGGLLVGLLAGFLVWHQGGAEELAAAPRALLTRSPAGADAPSNLAPGAGAIRAGSDGRRHATDGAEGAGNDGLLSAAGGDRAAADDLGALVPSALLAHARASYLEASRAFGFDPTDDRAEEALAEFRRGVLALPRSIAAEHWRRRTSEQQRAETVREALAEGDGLALLDLLASGACELTDHAAAQLVDELAPARAGGTMVDAALPGEPAVLLPGTTLRFGPGAHALDLTALVGPGPFPRDLVLAGAGMDATLLRVSDVHAEGDVERLTLRDMTIDCGDDGLFDLRAGRLLVDAQRVRIVRFDAGHGGCVVFHADGGMVRMTDSEILGGFGRAPGRGRLFGGGAFLVHLTDCRLELLDPTLEVPALGLVERCRLERLPPGARERVARIELVGCSFGPPLAATAEAPPPRALSEVFPPLR